MNSIHRNSPSASKSSGAGEIRVLVVDDSAVIRGLTKRWVEAEADMCVVATASNGLRAVEEAKKVKPDVVVLDIEMPKMDGLTALPQILKAVPTAKVVMSSTLTVRNAETSLKALSLGAADYVAKPEASSELNAPGGFQRELVGKIRALAGARRPAARRGAAPAAKRPAGDSGGHEPWALASGKDQITLRPGKAVRPDILLIGSSTGGPQALQTVLRSLGGKPKQPILITQHMPPTFTTILAQHIDALPGIRCFEAKQGMPVEPGTVYLAPGDHHMLIEGRAGACSIKLTQDPPENFCRPAVDPMFRSALEMFGSKILAVILTGMGNDGLAGGRMIVEKGGTMIAQDEATSVVWGMPGAVASKGLCSAVLPVDKIGPAIARFAEGGGL